MLRWHVRETDMLKQAMPWFVCTLLCILLKVDPALAEKAVSASAKALDAVALKLSPTPFFALQAYEASYHVQTPEEDEENKHFNGDMFVSLSEEDGSWRYLEEGSGRLIFRNSVVQLSWVYKTREAKDGTSFHFEYVVQKGKETLCQNKGSVSFDPLSKTGFVHWKLPYVSTVPLSNDIVFPMGLLGRIMEGARKVPYTFSAHLFDGQTQKLLPAVSCFISQPRNVQWFNKTDTSSRHLTVWPIFQALYQEKEEGERLLPTERRQFLMTQRGLALKTLKRVGGVSLLCVLRLLNFKGPSEVTDP